MECSICYEEMRAGSRHVLGCKHTFHKACLSTWLRTAHTCPMCRAIIPDTVRTRVGGDDSSSTMSAVIGRFLRVLHEYNHASSADEKAFKLHMLMQMYERYHLAYDERIRVAVSAAGISIP